MKNNEKYPVEQRHMRLFNSMRNTSWNFVCQILLIFAGLFLKRVLLQTLGTEKIGLNYLFTDVVSLISIAELGLTSIIAYHLYEPLAKGNEYKVKQIMNFFQKTYKVLGSIVLLVGFSIIPFLGHLTKETSLSFTYIAVVFALFILRSAEGYFLSYKQLLLYADQKNYMIAIIDIVTTIIYSVLSIIVLWYTRSFIYVIILEIIKKIINDLILIRTVNKKYPYMLKKNVPPIEKSDIKIISTDVKNTFISTICSAIISATDNIVLFIYFGMNTIGLFSNYDMVLKIVKQVLVQLLQSVQASVGNLLVIEKGEVIYSVLRKITFISFFMVSVCGCVLIQLITPFVSLWFGKSYVMVEAIVWVCVFNVFLYIMQLGFIQYAVAAGLFKETKKIDLMGCIINVVLSIIGVKIIGIVGVFLATSIARSIEFIFRIKLVHTKIIVEVDDSKHVIKILGFFLVFISEVIFLKIITNMINIQNPIGEFLLYGTIAVILPCLVNIVVYHSSEDFIYMIQIIKMFLNKKAMRQKKEVV